MNVHLYRCTLFVRKQSWGKVVVLIQLHFSFSCFILANSAYLWHSASHCLCNSTCWPLICVPCGLVSDLQWLTSYRWTDAPFTGVLKNFRTSAKKFRTWSKFQDSSGQLLQFQEFRNNGQAWPLGRSIEARIGLIIISELCDRLIYW